MLTILPINPRDLLYHQGIESARVEFKASWDPKTTGLQVLKTICAFANDFQNLNGGYILIGVEEQDGRAIMPPRGLSDGEVAAAEKWVREQCNILQPPLVPLLSPELVEGRTVLVLWVPASQNRPHQAPESLERGASRRFYIRVGSHTVEADKKPNLRTQLLNLAATIPFDDRRALRGTVDDIRETKVREFLHRVDSGLDMNDTKALYRHLNLADPVNGHDAPRNFALLCFSQNPEEWYRGARIEVAIFPEGASGDIIEERVFKNRPIQEQLEDCQTYLENFITLKIQKSSLRPAATHSRSYPIVALREALANAVYHRSYENNPEPTKVHVYPDRMEIISYPGPVPGIDRDQLNEGRMVSPAPARNRRIGELLKELKLAEARWTGLIKIRKAMADNGSPPPSFDFDEDRTWFRVILPSCQMAQAEPLPLTATLPTVTKTGMRKKLSIALIVLLLVILISTLAILIFQKVTEANSGADAPKTPVATSGAYGVLGFSLDLVSQSIYS